MLPLSERAMSLQESAIRKLDLTMMSFTDVKFYRLNIGQPDVATPAPLLEALAAFQPNVLAYGPASGTPECRAEAAAYHRRWGAKLSASDVAVTTGGSEALLFAMVAICNPGDEIIVPEPYYTNYNGFATVAGAVIKPLRTTLEEGFALPSDDALDAVVTPKTRAIMFSNPGNPTGAVYSKEELRRVLSWATRRGLYVIADEVYRRIWFDAPPTSALEFEDAAEHVVVVDSMSKTYSACGLRLGFLISRNRTFMEKVERLGQARLGPQPAAQAVALAGLALRDEYYDGIREVYAERVGLLHERVSAIPGVKTHRPAGAFYLMAELPIDDADAFARFMVEEFRDGGESLVVAPATGFYANPEDGRRQIRLAAVVDRPHLERAAELLALGIAAYQRRG